MPQASGPLCWRPVSLIGLCPWLSHRACRRYFALIIRAISVLEGIALVGDPNFAIVDQSYPYVARQLLASRSPRLREALRYTIYGKEGRFNAERLIDLLVTRCTCSCSLHARSPMPAASVRGPFVRRSAAKGSGLWSCSRHARPGE